MYRKYAHLDDACNAIVVGLITWENTLYVHKNVCQSNKYNVKSWNVKSNIKHKLIMVCFNGIVHQKRKFAENFSGHSSKMHDFVS